MPLQEAFAERRGNKIKQFFIRLGALLGVFIVVFSCIIAPSVATAAVKGAATRGATLTDEITVGNTKMELGYALENEVSDANSLSAVMTALDKAVKNTPGEAPYSSVLYMSEYENNDKIMDNLAAAVVDELGYVWDLAWYYKVYPMIGWGVGIADAINGAVTDDWFDTFDEHFPSFLNEAASRGLITPSDFKDYLDYYTMYEIIAGESSFVMPDVNINDSESIKEATEYILMNGNKNYWIMDSGTTLREILEDTNNAFKALMVGSVASSYAGALNSITKATEDAKEDLEKSLDGGLQIISGTRITTKTLDNGTVVEYEESYEEEEAEDQTNADLYKIFSQICSLVMVPVAGVILAFVFVFQLYDGINENNNTHGTDAWWFINLLIKMAIMILVVIFSWQLVEFVFNMGAWMVDQTEAAAIENELNGGTMLSTIKEYCEDSSIDQDTALKWVLAYMIDLDESIDFGATLVMMIQGLVINVGMFVVSLVVWIIVFVRMIEMYIYCCVSPIPLATLMNRSWNQIGMNFIRGVVALAFQAFIIFLSLTIFNVLVSSTIEAALFESNGITSAMWQVIGYGLVLIFCLFKSGSLSRSILSAR